MKHLIWLLKWILKAAIFFTLFAFALNNQQDATVHFFFGTAWRTPLVLVVLAAFAAGLVAPVEFGHAGRAAKVLAVLANGVRWQGVVALRAGAWHTIL